MKVALAAGTLLAILLTTSFSSFASVCEEIRADTLRFHILANSDSEQDQALKLRVRDAVLAETGTLFSGAEDKSDAEQTADEHLALIQQTAEQVIDKAGYDYPVKVYRTNMYFATTSYPRPAGGSYTLPAGRYDAVRIEIGKAAGHNWFCVLFPQLCLPAAEGEAAADTLYSDDEKQVLESGYELRFALVEWLTPKEKSTEPAPSPTPSPAPTTQLMASRKE